MMIDIRRRAASILFITVMLFVVGTAGYIFIEGWSLLDALYMTVITLTTVGFGEVLPLSAYGRFFTIFLIIGGVSIVAYSLTTTAELIVTGNIARSLRRRRMTKAINQLENHTIICGYGRVGKNAALSLTQNHKPVVIIDNDPQKIEKIIEDGFIAIEGDATNDDTLLQAGIQKAQGLIVSSSDDSLNLFIVLSARALNPDIFIVTRSINEANEPKMRRAGANRVVSPYQIGGKHMANIILHPHVTDFFDVVTFDGGIELWVEEVTIRPNSQLDGKTVGEMDIRRKTGVTLVALYRHQGQKAILPQADTRLHANDQLIVLGTREQLAKLVQLAKNTPKT
ncbi:MAG: potassium channel protein [Candidatus Promineifilaceae bacterium]